MNLELGKEKNTHEIGDILFTGFFWNIPYQELAHYGPKAKSTHLFHKDTPLHTHTQAKKCFLHCCIAEQIKRRICYMKFKLQCSQLC